MLTLFQLIFCTFHFVKSDSSLRHSIKLLWVGLLLVIECKKVHQGGILSLEDFNVYAVIKSEPWNSIQTSSCKDSKLSRMLADHVDTILGSISISAQWSYRILWQASKASDNHTSKSSVRWPYENPSTRMEHQYQWCISSPFVIHIVTAIYPVVGDYIGENANIEFTDFLSTGAKCHSYNLRNFFGQAAAAAGLPDFSYPGHKDCSICLNTISYYSTSSLNLATWIVPIFNFCVCLWR